MGTFWKSWVLVIGLTILILSGGWFWQKRDGLLWAVPLALSINYFLLIPSRLRIVARVDERDLEGTDGWQLNQALKQLCEKAKLPLPHVVVIESETPQAFVVGRFAQKTRIYVTQGFLDRLTPLERESILAFEVAAIQLRLPYIFSVLGSFLDLIYWVLGSIDQIISWVIGTRRDWAKSASLFLASPILFLIQRWCLSRSDYFKADQMAAELCSDREALCQALWKIESSNWTQPLDIHPAWTHAFAVGPWEPKGALGLLQPQPSAKERIMQLNGHFPL